MLMCRNSYKKIRTWKNENQHNRNVKIMMALCQWRV